MLSLEATGMQAMTRLSGATPCARLAQNQVITPVRRGYVCRSGSSYGVPGQPLQKHQDSGKAVPLRILIYRTMRQPQLRHHGAERLKDDAIGFHRGLDL